MDRRRKKLFSQEELFTESPHTQNPSAHIVVKGRKRREKTACEGRRLVAPSILYRITYICPASSSPRDAPPEAMQMIVGGSGLWGAAPSFPFATMHNKQSLLEMPPNATLGPSGSRKTSQESCRKCTHTLRRKTKSPFRPLNLSPRCMRMWRNPIVDIRRVLHIVEEDGERIVSPISLPFPLWSLIYPTAMEDGRGATPIHLACLVPGFYEEEGRGGGRKSPPLKANRGREGGEGTSRLSDFPPPRATTAMER